MKSGEILQAPLHFFHPCDAPGFEEWERALKKYPWPLHAMWAKNLFKEGIYIALNSRGQYVVLDGNNRFARLHQLLHPTTIVEFTLINAHHPETIDQWQREKAHKHGIYTFQDFLTATELGAFRQ